MADSANEASSFAKAMEDKLQKVIAEAIRECVAKFHDPVYFYIRREAKYRWEVANPEGDWWTDTTYDELDSYKIIADALIPPVKRAIAEAQLAEPLPASVSNAGYFATPTVNTSLASDHIFKIMLRQWWLENGFDLEESARQRSGTEMMYKPWSDTVCDPKLREQLKAKVSTIVYHCKTEPAALSSNSEVAADKIISRIFNDPLFNAAVAALIERERIAWLDQEVAKFAWGQHDYAIVRDWLAHTASQLRAAAIRKRKP